MTPPRGQRAPTERPDRSRRIDRMPALGSDDCRHQRSRLARRASMSIIQVACGQRTASEPAPGVRTRHSSSSHSHSCEPAERIVEERIRVQLFRVAVEGMPQELQRPGRVPGSSIHAVSKDTLWHATAPLTSLAAAAVDGRRIAIGRPKCFAPFLAYGGYRMGQVRTESGLCL